MKNIIKYWIMKGGRFRTEDVSKEFSITIYRTEKIFRQLVKEGYCTRKRILNIDFYEYNKK